MDWLLVDFSRRTAGVRHSLVVTRDGLRLAASDRIDIGLADQLAAISSGLVSLAQGAARAFAAEPVQQTIVEMAGGYLFVSSISEGAVLAVFADRYCDIGMIGYEMTLLATRVGHLLSPAPRVSSGGAAP
jgi:predicted regulator of Ras-like GTPase activity (Roadblock/LC7/MglB family)